MDDWGHPLKRLFLVPCLTFSSLSKYSACSQQNTSLNGQLFAFKKIQSLGHISITGGVLFDHYRRLIAPTTF